MNNMVYKKSPNLQKMTIIKGHYVFFSRETLIYIAKFGIWKKKLFLFFLTF